MNEYLVSVLYEYMGEYLIGKHTLYGDTAVSYTHLTLPTIYSV